MSATNICTLWQKVIEITMVGAPFLKKWWLTLGTFVAHYELEGVELRLIQSSSSDDGAREREHEQDLSDLVNSSTIKTQDEKIRELESQLGSFTSKDRVVKAAAKEVNILFPIVESISFGDLLVQNTQDFSSSKETSLLVKWKTKPTAVDRKRLELFLKSRLETDALVILDVE